MLDLSRLDDNHQRNGEVIEEEEEDSMQTERAAAKGGDAFTDFNETFIVQHEPGEI